MSPVDSDLFQASDFATTFGKLDAVPGTTIVPNYAGLPTTWGIPQHGSRVLQADTGAEWFWYNPSSTGVWKRTNSLGLLSLTTQGAAVSTTLHAAPGPTFITSGNFTAPGKRALHVHLDMGIDNSSGTNGIVIITLLDNGVQIDENIYRTGLVVGTLSTGTSFQAHAYIQNPTPASTHNITAQIRSASLAQSSGGGGTSVARTSTLAITEL
jgi:hypothetical protein